jgi:hypothetical protein
MGVFLSTVETMRQPIRSFALLFLLLVGSLSALPALALDSASDALTRAYDAMLNSRGVIDSVATGADGKPANSRIEFDTLKRLRMTSDETSMIMLPEGTWMRTGGTDWIQPPIDMSAMFERLLPASREVLRTGTRNIRDEGVKSIDGAELRVISYDITTKMMGITVNSRNTTYLDASGRIVRTISDGEAMGQKTHSVQTIRYDDSIRVMAPN